MMNTIVKILTIVIVLFSMRHDASALIEISELTSTEAKKLGISVQHRNNGDAGVMVWVEFKKEGALKAFAYCEFQMKDANGKHVVSAMLQPRPVVHGQPEELTSVSFSAELSWLPHCAFLIVTSGSGRGGVGYQLNVKDFIGAADAGE